MNDERESTEEDFAEIAAVLDADTSVPGYRALALIGRGGQGAVYRALQVSTGRIVALKLIRRPEVSSSAFERFKRERELICQLRHPHVVNVLDAGVVDDRQYLAMEFVDGPTLEDWLRARAPLGGAEAALLLLPLCEAVAHAHRQGVTHRDLKPQNVLLQRVEGARSEWAPKIADFGLARVLEGTDLHFATARNQDRMSSFAYSAPEMLGETVAPPDTRIDVFGLGALLYRMLAGEDPRQGLTHAQASAVTGLAAYRGIARLRRDQRALGRDLEAMVFQAMAPDPNARYPTVQDLAADLRRFLDGRPVQAMPRRWSYVLGKSLRRHRAAWSLGAAAVMLAVVGLTAWIIQAEHTRTQSLRVSTAMTAHAREGDEIFRNLLVPLKDALGSSAPALAMARQMVASRERMIADYPGNAVLIEGLIAFRETIGDLLMAESRQQEALPEFKAAWQLLTAHSDVVGDPERARSANILQAKIGNAIKAWDVPRALAIYEQVLENDRARLAAHREHPNAAQFADDLAWSLQRLSGLLYDSREHGSHLVLAPRLEALHRDFDSLHAVVADDPWRALDVRLAQSLTRTAWFQCIGADYASWVAEFREGARLAEELQALGRPSAHYEALLLGRSYVRATDLLYAGDARGIEEAGKYFAQLDRMIERSPGNTAFQILKAESLRECARNAHWGAEFGPLRCAWMEEALRLYDELGENLPEGVDRWGKECMIHVQFAVEYASSKSDLSVHHFSAARTILETHRIAQDWEGLARSANFLLGRASELGVESQEYWTAHQAFVSFLAQKSAASEGR